MCIRDSNYRFGALKTAADAVMKFKYIIKNGAWENGKTATFMPKPIFGDNGSGMHCHQSLWKDGKPLFFDEKGYGGLSDMARWYVGGLLKHAPSLLAFTNPTVNSYHRLVPGFEAPVNLVYSARNRSACIRIPVTGSSPKAKRIEFRVPDPSSNPYLAFAAMLMAGLDGLEADSDYLTAGNVFTPDLIATWIDYKRTQEITPIRLRPHPHEFELYY